MFRVLIVDDFKTMHSYVKNFLTKAKDIQTASVFNGAEALRMLEGDEKFDLILLDWEMPVLNGPDTFQRIKAMGLDTPILMMTTKNDPADVQKMLNMGAAEYLIKPFTIDILFEKIEFATGRTFSYAA